MKKIQNTSPDVHLCYYFLVVVIVAAQKAGLDVFTSFEWKSHQFVSTPLDPIFELLLAKNIHFYLGI
jgi:hypothetical protein